MINKDLQKARQEWFLEELEAMKLDNKGAEISKKTGYSKQTISGYLSNSRLISLDFMRTFCDVYKYDFDAINHMLIEKVKNELQNPNNEKKINVGTGFSKSLVNNTFDSLNKKSEDETDMKWLTILDRMTQTEERHSKNYEQMLQMIREEREHSRTEREAPAKQRRHG